MALAVYYVLYCVAGLTDEGDGKYSQGPWTLKNMRNKLFNLLGKPHVL